MKFSWGVFYAFLFAYRSAYSYLAQTVITRFTSLGDSNSIQGRGARLLEDQTLGVVDNRVVATELTDALGALLFRLLGGDPVLINIGFQAIAFVGIVAVIQAARGRERYWLAGLALLPSFTIWSSVASKEAIVVLAMGIISAYLIRSFRGERSIGLALIGSLAVVYLFKDHYIPAIAFIIFGGFVASRVKQKAAIALVGSVVSLFLIYLFRDTVDQLAFSVIPHFQGLGSSRDAFWIDQYDVFWRAPYGMFLGFFGATAVEAGQSVFLLASFLESAAIVVILAAIITPKLVRLPVFILILGGMTIFWILFATYPLGVLNAGSAIRYRTGFEFFIFAILVSVMSRRSYLDFAAPSNSASRKVRATPRPGGSRPATGQLSAP